MNRKNVLLVAVSIAVGFIAGGITARKIVRNQLASLGLHHMSEVSAMHYVLSDWAQLGRYAEENKSLPAKVPGRVVFFGDSITEHWKLPRGYVNRGISGQTTSQMVLRFQQDVIDLHPQTVVILAGTNDVLNLAGMTRPGMTLANIRTMVDAAKEHGIHVILCTIPPLKYDGASYSSQIKELNELVGVFSYHEGVGYVDYYGAMVDRNGLSIDGVHPSEAGYKIMDKLILQALENNKIVAIN